MSNLLLPLKSINNKLKFQTTWKRISRISRISPISPLNFQSIRKFAGPQEPPDMRDPADVEPDYWDAWQWEKVIKDLEHEIEHYDSLHSIVHKEDFEYDLKFAKKMLEWRKLEEVKYLQFNELWEEGAIESAFAIAGYKLRAELDFRVIGGRGGYDTKQQFNDGTFLYGPFGTEDNPVLIPSRGRYRFVGCLGGYNGTQEHEVAWFPLKQGPKHRCPLCGQVFQLWTTDSSHPDHPYHDTNKDYEKEIIAMLDEGRHLKPIKIEANGR